MRLRQLRLKLGLTQVELAKRSGVGQALISIIETHRRPNPAWSTAHKLARALGVDPRELFPLPKVKTRIRRAEERA